MGILGETKYERKLTDLLLRLFGKDDVRCMNLQSGKGGLLADMRDDLKAEIQELRNDVRRLESKAETRGRKK